MTTVEAALAAHRATPTETSLTAVLHALEPVMASSVRRALPRYLPSWIDVDDLMARGRVTVLRCVAQFEDQRKGSLTRYVADAVKYQVLHALRDANAQKRKVRMLTGAAGERAAANAMDPRPNPEEAAVFSELRDFVAQLPKPDRLVLEGYYFEGRTDEELAAIRGVARQSVTERRHRALAKLQSIYADEESTPG